MTHTKPIWYIVASALILVIAYLAITSQKVQASAPSGLPTVMATTSQAAVSSTASLVFATSSCAARIISTTGAGGIMISFTDRQGFVPSATLGFWQAASTTVAYDSGQYGCSAVRIYSGASQIITVGEGQS